METLPDYLKVGLDVVFVGINPGWQSAQEGHYFATSRNRFWTAFNAARMAEEDLGPSRDMRILDYGMGLTDVVKRPTRSMAELRASDFREGAIGLHAKLLKYVPRLVCFNGVSGYKGYAKNTIGLPPSVTLGVQTSCIGKSRVFVLPSTSPANASIGLEEIVHRMRELKSLVQSTKVE